MHSSDKGSYVKGATTSPSPINDTGTCSDIVPQRGKSLNDLYIKFKKLFYKLNLHTHKYKIVAVLAHTNDRRPSDDRGRR